MEMIFMTKKFFLILLGVMFFCSSICSAAISANRFFLGGLTVGSKMSDAIKIYGFPTKTAPAGDTIHCIYDHWFGNGSLIISEGADGDIQSISVNANNGISTADGIKVGMNINKVFQIYGKEDFTYNNHKGTTYYVYNKVGSPYYDLQFAVESTNEIIMNISLHNSV